MGLLDLFRKKGTATPNPDAERGDWMKWFLNREGLGGMKFSPGPDPRGYIDYAPWQLFNGGGSVQSGPRTRQKLQPKGLESLRQMANIPTHRLPQEQRTMKNIMRDMEGSTRDSMENYFFENEGDTSMYQLGEMRPPAFSGSVGTQVRPYDYGGTMFPSIELDNDEGIDSLPEGKMEPDLETMRPNAARTPMTDEQKDYLYDYMLDFMMKQRMQEQQEMEGRIPLFNYDGLEV